MWTMCVAVKDENEADSDTIIVHKTLSATCISDQITNSTDRDTRQENLYINTHAHANYGVWVAQRLRVQVEKPESYRRLELQR